MGEAVKLINSGAYRIECIINNKNYIGTCDNFKSRERRHFRELEKNIHGNPHLQKDYNKYGKESFRFIILLEIIADDNELVEIENSYIKKYKTHIPTWNNQYGYNTRWAMRLNKKQRSNLSNSLKGRESGMKNKNHTEESKKLMGKVGELNPMYGKIRDRKIESEEICLNIKFDLINIKFKTFTEIENKLAEKYNTTPRQIKHIRMGTHWSSKSLKGSLKDWLKEESH